MTRGRTTAVNPSANVIAGGARNVFPADVLDGEARAVAVLASVDAWRDIDGLVDVGEPDIAEQHILYSACAWVGFDPGCVAAVRECDVLEDDVLDIVGLRRLRPNAADHHAARLVAYYIADVQIRGVPFGTDAVLRKTSLSEHLIGNGERHIHHRLSLPNSRERHPWSSKYLYRPCLLWSIEWKMSHSCRDWSW